MENKGIIVFLTVVVSALCLYYLSFTLVSNKVESRAEAYATDEAGNIDFAKRQSYLDSVWRQPVYNFLGASFTFQEVKETELGQGLDIQGGMQVTLAVSPVEIVRGLSGDSKDPGFTTALEEAQERAKVEDNKFVDIFYEEWQEHTTDRNLSSVFATAA